MVIHLGFRTNARYVDRNVHLLRQTNQNLYYGRQLWLGFGCPRLGRWVREAEVNVCKSKILDKIAESVARERDGYCNACKQIADPTWSTEGIGTANVNGRLISMKVFL